MGGQDLSWAQPLRDLHLDKVALITGGSGGIGAQAGRVLALCGAKVMLAARRADELREVADNIVAELAQSGYSDPAGRVQYLANCDVSNPAQVEGLARRTLEIFGQVDYLINNAAVTGGEAMVIDLPLQTWRETLQANLISNYTLIRLLAPQMKARGSGYIINVSSYFGGEKNMAIAYPNRADYGLSKAGQRAMVENLARFVGPEIQINTFAPGPVDGERLRGSSARPSMFSRRARVILENRRLNEIYTVLVQLNRSGMAVDELLGSVLANVVEAVQHDSRQPEGLRRLARALGEQSDRAASSHTHFLNPALAARLVQRLAKGGYLSQSVAARLESLTATPEKLLGKLPPEPFFSPAEFASEARRIEERNLSMLYLKRMPTDFDLAMALAYQLKDRYITGETFHSSGGLKMERAVSEGELFGHPNPQRLAQLKGATIFIYGEFLQQYMTRLAQTYLAEHQVARIVFLTETEASAARIRESFAAGHFSQQVTALATGDQLEESFELACRSYGKPEAVISTPFRPLPRCRLSGTAGDWEQVLSPAGFAGLIEEQITHHFRIAQRASYLDNARVVLVTPPTGASSSHEEFALANFIKTTLHAFTATLGAESERTVHYSAVNQVALTRRARDEEPQNHSEEEEELERFVNAVLLTTTPLPGPAESRYRSRIYRGNVITV